MQSDELKYFTEAYETNWMSTVGANINEVERLACQKVGCKYAVTLSCGTAALHLAVKLAGVKAGDQAFCPDMTFAATVNPVVCEGAIPGVRARLFYCPQPGAAGPTRRSTAKADRRYFQRTDPGANPASQPFWHSPGKKIIFRVLLS